MSHGLCTGGRCWEVDMGRRNLNDQRNFPKAPSRQKTQSLKESQYCKLVRTPKPNHEGGAQERSLELLSLGSCSICTATSFGVEPSAWVLVCNWENVLGAEEHWLFFLFDYSLTSTTLQPFEHNDPQMPSWLTLTQDHRGKGTGKQSS